MTNLPSYLLRQVYYFLLERPEINKKTNIEKIQAFFSELGIACNMDQRFGIRLSHTSEDKKMIDLLNVPNFLNEKDFISWVTDLINKKS